MKYVRLSITQLGAESPTDARVELHSSSVGSVLERTKFGSRCWDSWSEAHEELSMGATLAPGITREIGKELYKAVFGPKIAEAWGRLYAEDTEIIRLFVEVKQDSEEEDLGGRDLSFLPYGWMHSGSSFLVSDPRVKIIRNAPGPTSNVILGRPLKLALLIGEQPGGTIDLKAIKPLLQFLHVLSKDRSEDFRLLSLVRGESGFHCRAISADSDLAVGDEDDIVQSLATTCSSCTDLEAIHQPVQENCHVIHVIAHGFPDGAILWRDKKLPPNDFAKALRKLNPKLVFLQVCYGTFTSNSVLSYGSVSRALNEERIGNIPLVVGAPYPLDQVASTRLALSYYRELLKDRLAGNPELCLRSSPDTDASEGSSFEIWSRCRSVRSVGYDRVSENPTATLRHLESLRKYLRNELDLPQGHHAELLGELVDQLGRTGFATRLCLFLKTLHDSLHAFYVDLSRLLRPSGIKDEAVSPEDCEEKALIFKTHHQRYWTVLESCWERLRVLIPGKDRLLLSGRFDKLVRNALLNALESVDFIPEYHPTQSIGMRECFTETLESLEKFWRICWGYTKLDDVVKQMCQVLGLGEVESRSCFSEVENLVDDTEALLGAHSDSQALSKLVISLPFYDLESFSSTGGLEDLKSRVDRVFKHYSNFRIRELNSFRELTKTMLRSDSPEFFPEDIEQMVAFLDAVESAFKTVDKQLQKNLKKYEKVGSLCAELYELTL